MRGDYTGESDIAILLVLHELNSKIIDEIVDTLFDFQLKYDTNISPVIYSEYAYKMNAELGSPFIKKVEQEGISL